ncbi:MAG: T9SS type A sorting domain-containing protein [Bacteroidales bacterium]|nr:T9SS type A sorting domain-containing protein [Bacteroidales bacterium]
MKPLSYLAIFCIATFASSIRSFGNTVSKFSKAPEEKTISVENQGKPKEKENTLYTTEKSWDEGDRHFHVTPKGDTIVSFATLEAANKSRENKNLLFLESSKNPSRGISDLVYDPADPSFGLVPYLHGNDTIPLINDIAIKNRSNRQSQIDAANAADWTDGINASSSGWDCNQYARQNASINLGGVYDIENSELNSGSGNLPYDFSGNGDGETPAYTVITTTTDGTPHRIGGAFVGSSEGVEYNNASDFSQWYFWEPQTDETVTPGDFSMSANNEITIKWFGYTYDQTWNTWGYEEKNILKFDLNNGVPALTYEVPNFTSHWTPLDQIQNPANTSGEFPIDESVAANGVPTGLYLGTNYTVLDQSSQTNDGTCSDVHYEVARTFDFTAGDYNSSNTANGSHVQYINSVDITAPNEDGTDNSGLEVIVQTNEISTQGSDPNQCENYNYEVFTRTTLTDQCGNEATHDSEPQYFSDTEGPYVATTPFTQGDTIYRALPTDSPDPTESEKATFADDQAPVGWGYDKVVVEEDQVHVLYQITQTARNIDDESTDPCGNPSEEFYHYVNVPKPDGIEKLVKNTELTRIGPNPTSSTLNIMYNGTDDANVSIYNMAGQEIYNTEMSASNDLVQYNASGLASGIYAVKTVTKNTVDTDEFVKR